MRRLLVLSLILACGCAGTPELSEPICVPDKKMVRDPARVWPFFKKCFGCEHWSYAHKALQPGTIDYDPFYIALASFTQLRQVITESHMLGPVEDVAPGVKRITVCNETHGFLEQYTLHKTFGVIWTIGMSEKQINRIRDYAFDYFNYQYEAEGDFFVYPRGVKKPKKWTSCRRDTLDTP